MLRSATIALLAAALLFLVFVVVVSGISGWEGFQSQLARYWPYLLALDLGFGLQVGLYAYLRRMIRQARGLTSAVAAGGTTSTVTMVSCCAHYLATAIPILGATGLAAFVGQYQVQLFWVGLVGNALGLAWMSTQLFRFRARLRVHPASPQPLSPLTL